MDNSENDSLELIVSAQLPDLMRFAVRLTGDPEAAEEVVGEAMVRAVRSWKSFRGESQAATWLKRIVINAFRDWVADRPVAEPIVEEIPDRVDSNPAVCALAGELGGLIAAKVSALPPRQREVLVLIVYEGLSVGETAKLLDIRESNVHATLYAARKSLRRSLASYLREESHER
jgi:RNA polymerase sigma-70 factor (ECF subfamily)